MEELKEMCRVCMAEAEDLLDIYDKTKTHVDDRLSQALKRMEEPEPSLPELLKECSPICVEPDDPFPKKVCDPCLRKLRDAVFFHRRYAKTMQYIDRVKVEKNDQDIINDLEQEEWELQNGDDGENKDEDDEKESDDFGDDEDDYKADAFEDDEDDYQLDDSEDDEDDEYMPVPKRRKKGSFQCPDCPNTFNTEAQLTIHSAEHSKGSTTKQNGLKTRPKRSSAKY